MNHSYIDDGLMEKVMIIK